MKLKLNISPCPNDTFMFEALLNGRIDCEGLEFDVRFADIEELNSVILAKSDTRGGIESGGCGEKNLTDASVCRVGRGLTSGVGTTYKPPHLMPDVSKISYAILPEIIDRYSVLDSGSALGRGNGPLFVSREEVNLSDPSLHVAIPGLHTTANLLMKQLYPEIKNLTPCLFSEIADRVMEGEFDAGVLIHEGRFTYAKRGLRLISDLGVKWEKSTSLDLPLGAIIVANSLTRAVQIRVGRVLERSIRYGLENPKASLNFVCAHAQEMELDVIENHIKLFVNNFSLSLGEVGREAVRRLLGLSEDEQIFISEVVGR